MTVVVSQPMFLPWLGLFEQMRLADVFVHYDDVQMPLGRSLMSRVQIKTQAGQAWVTAPIDRNLSGKTINSIFYLKDSDWRTTHKRIFSQQYSKAPHKQTMLDLVEELYDQSTNQLSEFNIYAIERIARFLGLKCKFELASKLQLSTASSERLVDICKKFEATKYVTGLGALNYLNYDLFEANKIEVNYMAYQKRPYPQLYGEFIPYVTALDSIANCGAQARDLVVSKSIYWKDYINGSY